MTLLTFSEPTTFEKKVEELFNLESVDPSWRLCLIQALKKIDSEYLKTLYSSQDWLPGHEKIFNAFSLPVDKTKYVLFGESPYPREQSANGYAFWDNAVNEIWSDTGLSKRVNRATSLRNIIKMLLIAEEALPEYHTSQSDIAQLDKSSFIETNCELFRNFINHGFLLLNATPILRPNLVKQDAQAWQPFIKHVLEFLFTHNPSIQIILFGKIANAIDKLISHTNFPKLYAEHPYNISFIHNPEIIAFFKPFHLLRKT